jgi:hypothetical protein
MQTFVGDLIIHEVHHPAKIQKKLLETLRDHGITADPYPPAEAARNSLLKKHKL